MSLKTTLIAIGCFCLGMLLGIALPKLFGEALKIQITHEIKLAPKLK